MWPKMAKIWNLHKEMEKNFFYYIKPHYKTWSVWGGKEPTLLRLTNGFGFPLKVTYHSPLIEHFDKNPK